MKILVVSSHEQHFGGGEGRLSYEFAVEMSKRHEVVLICPSTKPDPLPEGAHLVIYPLRSIDFTLAALTGGEMRAILRFLDTFDPDIIHSHTPWIMGAILQAWAHIRGVPFYFTAHELPSKMLDWGLVRYLSAVSRTSLLHKLTSTYLVSFCRHCTAVVALNKAALDDIRGVGYRGRMFVIPNGRTLSLYDGKRPIDMRRPERFLTFVGDFTPRKNQKYLVTVLNYLPPEYRLVLVGHYVDHQYMRDIEAEIGPALRDRVIFTGRLEHALVPEQLARTHVWVSASLMEVQSLAVMEALASGTPVVGLSNETIDELIDSDVGARLPKDAPPEEFARAVQALCESTDETYGAVCRNARTRARPYDWNHNMDLTERMYSLTSKGKGKTRRGNIGLPLLFATAQTLLSMIMFLIVQLVAFVDRLQSLRRVRAATAASRA
jgi:glycosyltransferase involved in cell wall biosynthesis